MVSSVRVLIHWYLHAGHPPLLLLINIFWRRCAYMLSEKSPSLFKLLGYYGIRHSDEDNDMEYRSVIRTLTAVSLAADFFIEWLPRNAIDIGYVTECRFMADREIKVEFGGFHERALQIKERRFAGRALTRAIAIRMPELLSRKIYR